MRILLVLLAMVLCFGAIIGGAVLLVTGAVELAELAQGAGGPLTSLFIGLALVLVGVIALWEFSKRLVRRRRKKKPSQ